jgi:hypothetical protein
MEIEALRVAVRAFVAFAIFLAIVRVSGKRPVHDGTTFDFVFSILLGDVVADAIWGEVPMSQFAVAAATLVGMQLTVGMLTREGAGAPRLAGAAAVLAVVLSVVALAVFGLGDRTVLTSPPERVAESFARQLAAHRYGQAVPLLDDDLAAREGPAALRARVAAIEQRAGAIERVHGESVRVDGDRAEAVARLTTERGGEVTMRLALARKHGVWKIAEIDPRIAPILSS